jgi:hypothetical protein
LQTPNYPHNFVLSAQNLMQSINSKALLCSCALDSITCFLSETNLLLENFLHSTDTEPFERQIEIPLLLKWKPPEKQVNA